MSNKKEYVAVAYITSVYVIARDKFDSKEEALKKLIPHVNTDESMTVSDADFDKMIEDKPLLRRTCDIDIGVFDENEAIINFDVE